MKEKEQKRKNPSAVIFMVEQERKFNVRIQFFTPTMNKNTFFKENILYFLIAQ